MTGKFFSPILLHLGCRSPLAVFFYLGMDRHLEQPSVGHDYQLGNNR